MALRAFLLAALAMLVASAGAFAHPDHREGDYVIEVRVGREENRIDVLVRTPLDLLAGVGLPLYGERFVDARAFLRPDPFASDGRTYEERAISAVRKAFTIEQEEGPVALTAQSARLSPGDDDQFGDYRAARERMVRDDDAPLDVDAWRGHLDIHFVGAVENAPISFVPALGSAMGSVVTFRFGGTGGDAASVPGDGGPIRLGAQGGEAVALHPLHPLRQDRRRP